MERLAAVDGDVTSLGRHAHDLAVFDATKTYRYLLGRDLEAWTTRARRVLWVMLNPSVADAFEDDATIRRVMSYSRAWGYGLVDVVNLYALRSTDPKALLDHPDPVGAHNDHYLSVAAARANLVVAAWGSHRAATVQRREHVEEILLSHAPMVYVLKLTKARHPVHPLRQPRGLRPKIWLLRGEQPQ